LPTTSSGLRYPALTDSPNGPLQIGNLAADLDGKVLPPYTTIALRNSAIPSPLQGRSATVAGTIHSYDGVAWRWARRALTNGTTDSSGFLVIPHGLGATPSGVITGSGPQASDLLNRIVSVNAVSWDSSNFTAYVKRTDTSAALISNQVQICWEAFV
jgi:hypothetical protein